MSEILKTKSLDQILQQKTRVVPGPIQDSLQALAEAIEGELGRILQRARAHELQLQRTLAEATLLSRKQAALLLNCSMGKLDRLSLSGAIEVTYIDRRPRFRLVELNRFIAAHTRSGMRRPRKSTSG